MDERERFEKWLRETYGRAVSLSETNGIYADPFAMALYTGWQAAKADQQAEIVRLREALEMVRDADNDSHADGLPTIPPIARAKIDRALAATEARTQPGPKDE